MGNVPAGAPAIPKYAKANSAADKPPLLHNRDDLQLQPTTAVLPQGNFV
jgi:hypothetical protein